MQRKFWKTAAMWLLSGPVVVLVGICQSWYSSSSNATFMLQNLMAALGLVDSDGRPHLKKWRVVTSSYRLARNLDAYKCEHPRDFQHSRLEGSTTSKSAFCMETMCRCVSNSFYVEDVPLMPTVMSSPEAQHQSNQPDQDDVFAAIHMLLGSWTES